MVGLPRILTPGVRAFSTATSRKSDVIVVGAGHNGLIAATLLAQQGLQVDVYEAKEEVGGACKTEYPFAKAPQLGQSTGAYLLGVMPPELVNLLRVDLPMLRRDPHYFLPTTDGRYLLFGSDEAATEQQFKRFFSVDDWKAHKSIQAELANLREDLAPAWFQQPLALEATAERFVRPGLRQIFVDLMRQPIDAYLERHAFKSDLLKAMYATTDAFSGLSGGLDTPGTGANFLLHNMCRLPGSDGTWMVIKGGMGTVSQALKTAALQAGVRIHTDTPVAAVERSGSGGAADGVLLEDGRRHGAQVVVVNADPFRMQALVGAAALPPEFNAKLEGLRRPGNTMKVNLALRGLPKFTCLPEEIGQHRTTTHILPQGNDVLQSLRQGFEDAQAGRLPEFPTMEIYFHTTVDPSIAHGTGLHSSALFVQWVPNKVQGSSWEVEEDAYVQHLLSIVDRFAPGTSDLVVDTFTLTPGKVEQHFGITHGHIHHIDNTFALDERVPHKLPLEGLYSCSAGTHPGGSVLGCAGYLAAREVAKDLGCGASWKDI